MSTDTKTHRILKFILFLSSSYPKTKNECVTYLEIGDTAFYSYCSTLKGVGFNLQQKEGRYWLDYSEQDYHTGIEIPFKFRCLVASSTF